MVRRLQAAEERCEHQGEQGVATSGDDAAQSEEGVPLPEPELAGECEGWCGRRAAAGEA